jgi:hypothetical protein
MEVIDQLYAQATLPQGRTVFIEQEAEYKLEPF